MMIMIACFDVQYQEETARAAAILFHDWQDEVPVAEYAIETGPVGAYQAGRFFERELQPLQQLSGTITQPISTYVIDAYCHLSEEAPGLGAYLSETLPHDTVIIGVAKNRYRDTQHAAEVFRGGSQRPLFVTAIGLDVDAAAAHISEMAGIHRIPTLLKAVDRLARGGRV